MNEIEKAIEYLSRWLPFWEERNKDSAVHVKTALEALKEKLERESGCGHCKTSISLLSGEDWVVFIDRNRLVCCVGGETHDYREIVSCPMCGRKLEVE